MKTFSKLYLLAATALGLTACNSDQDYLDAFQSDPDAVRFSVQIGGGNEADLVTKVNTFDDTKESAFDAGDEISVATDDQTAVVYKLDKDKGWQPSTTGQYLIWKTDPMNFKAFYPADASMEAFTQPAEFKTEDDLKAADYMTFSGEKNRPTGNDALTLQMERKMARVIFNVKDQTGNQYKSFTASSITMSINSTGYSANGVVSGSMTVKTFPNNNKQFYALVTPTTADGDETFLTIEGTADEQPVKLTITGIPLLEAGKSYTYNLTIGKDKATVANVVVENWKEGTITGGVAEETTYPIIDAEAHTITTNAVDQFTADDIDKAMGTGDYLKIIGPITKTKDTSKWSDLYTLLSQKVKNLDLSEADITLVDYAFRAKNSILETIILPEKVTALPTDAFYNCQQLTKVTCKGDIATIGVDAFGLLATTFTLDMSANTKSPEFTPNTTVSTAANQQDFGNYFCAGVDVTVYVKDSNVRSSFVANSTWSDGISSSDYSVKIGIPATFNASTHTLTLYDGGLFEDADLTAALAGGTTLKVVGPMGTTLSTYRKLSSSVKNLDLSGASMDAVKAGAFSTNPSSLSILETIILPTGVQTIGMQAFDGCQNLKTVTCLGTISKIDDWAFDTGLDGTLTINLNGNTTADQVPSLGDYVFNDTSDSSTSNAKTIVNVTNTTIRDAIKGSSDWSGWLTKGVSVVCPAKVVGSTIYTYEEGQLTKDMIKSISPTIVGPLNLADWTVLGNCGKDLKNLYLKDVTVGTDLVSNFKFQPSTTYPNFQKLETITLPSTLKEIPEKCAYNCMYLTTVTCPGQVTKIGNQAFNSGYFETLDLSGFTYSSTTKYPTFVSGAIPKNNNENKGIKIVFGTEAEANEFKNSTEWKNNTLSNTITVTYKQ